MTSLLVFFSLCAPTEIINRTNSWTAHDKHILEFNKGRCKQIWPELPCLKLFYKLGERDYYGVCGE